MGVATASLSWELVLARNFYHVAFCWSSESFIPQIVVCVFVTCMFLSGLMQISATEYKCWLLSFMCLKKNWRVASLGHPMRTFLVFCLKLCNVVNTEMHDTYHFMMVLHGFLLLCFSSLPIVLSIESPWNSGCVELVCFACSPFVLPVLTIPFCKGNL